MHCVQVSHFTDLARQLETFFLQKRFMIYNHKPEMILREDTTELKAELVRKDGLIRKHYDKLSKWKEMLADAQAQPQSLQPAGAGRGPGERPTGPGGQTPHGGFVPGNNYARMPGPPNQVSLPCGPQRFASKILPRVQLE